jgi:hypothetical protein
MKAMTPWLPFSRALVVSLGLMAVACATVPTSEFRITEEEARSRVERLREVGPYLRTSPNIILELDRGPTPDDPYYHFWFGQRVPPPGAVSGTISYYSVDARNGKVYRSATFEEVRE